MFKDASYATLTFDILESVKKWRKLSMNPAENTRLTWRFGEETGFWISIYLCNFDLRNIFIMLVYIESGITLSITDVAIKRFVFTFYGCFSLQDHYHDWNNKNCQKVNQYFHSYIVLLEAPSIQFLASLLTFVNLSSPEDALERLGTLLNRKCYIQSIYLRVSQKTGL